MCRHKKKITTKAQKNQILKKKKRICELKYHSCVHMHTCLFYMENKLRLGFEKGDEKKHKE